MCAEKVGQTNGQTAGEDLKRPTNQGNEISFISAYFLFFFPPSNGMRPTNKPPEVGNAVKSVRQRD